MEKKDVKKDLKEGFSGGRFFKFDKMITPLIIKIVFIIGIVFTTILGIAIIIMGMNSYYGGGVEVFIGILIILLGPIMVRIYCELMIVVFKIHEALEDIRRKM